MDKIIVLREICPKLNALSLLNGFINQLEQITGSQFVPYPLNWHGIVSERLANHLSFQGFDFC